MYCNNCGNYLEENAVFCPQCGTPVGSNTVIDGQTPAQGMNGGYAPNGYVNNPTGGMGYQQSNQPMYNQPPMQPQQPIYTVPVQPTVVNVQQTAPPVVKSANGLCVASFVLSICGLFILPFVCGAAALIFGVAGIVTYDESKHTSKWMAYVGIVVGAIGFVIGLIAVSLIAALFDSLLGYY